MTPSVVVLILGLAFLRLAFGGGRREGDAPHHDQRAGKQHEEENPHMGLEEPVLGEGDAEQRQKRPHRQDDCFR